jgi:hypothetical protein
MRGKGLPNGELKREIAVNTIFLKWPREQTAYKQACNNNKGGRPNNVVEEERKEAR